MSISHIADSEINYVDFFFLEWIVNFETLKADAAFNLVPQVYFAPMWGVLSRPGPVCPCLALHLHFII